MSKDSLTSDYDSIKLEDIEHVWYFEPILENILFVFVTHLLATRWMFVHEFVVFVTVKGWYCVTLTHLVYDGQFYCMCTHFGKCRMPNVLRSFQM